MLTAHLDETQADKAIAVLEQSEAMDLDLHEAEWRLKRSQRGIDEACVSSDSNDSARFRRGPVAGPWGRGRLL
jgi:hypothetical protein